MGTFSKTFIDTINKSKTHNIVSVIFINHDILIFQ